MEMSISKGCFLSRPKKKKRKSLLSSVGFEMLPGETKHDAVVRQKAFQYCWEQVENRFKDDINTSRQSVFSLFDKFLDQSTQDLCVDNGSNIIDIADAIPMAVIYEGSCLPSDESLLSKLKDSLDDNGSVGILLNASDTVGANIKTLMKVMMQQLISSQEDEISAVKLPDCSMNTLCGWYTELTAEKDTRIPICLLIDEFESFPLGLFQDLVAMLSSRFDDFPVLLSLGLHLPLNLQNVLSSYTLAKLNIVEMRTKSVEDRMKCILREITVEPDFPAKISPDCCQIILDNFKYTNSSLLSCMNLIKSILLDHFYWQPLSFLCTVEHEEIRDHVRKMSHSHCEMIRATPSFMSHIETFELSRITDLLNNDDSLKDLAVQLLMKISDYHLFVLPLLRTLLFFTFESNGKCDDDQKIQFMNNLCFFDQVSDVLDPLLEFLSFISIDDMKAAVTECVAFCKKYRKSLARKCKPHWLSGLMDNLVKFESQLEGLLKKPSELFSNYEQVKQAIAQYIRKFYSDHLCSVKSLPLHEVYYYTNGQSLHEQVNMSSRQSTIKALTTPQYYLKSPDCSVQSVSVPIPYPSVAYEHYKSMGRIISIPDWMEVCVSESEQQQSKEEQAGFLLSIAEMQFIGLCKSLPQKPDKLLKLYWDTSV